MGGHGGGEKQAASGGASSIGVTRDFKKGLEVDKLFKAMIKVNGSDLHLKVGKPATIRVRGDLTELNMPPITKDQMEQL